MLGAHHADLLRTGEHQVHVPVGRLGLQQVLHRLQNRGDAALVVAAQGGGAVGADDIALDDGVDMVAGLNLVGVGHKADGGAGQVAGNIGHDVAAVSAVGFAGLVGPDGDTPLREVALQPVGHGSLTLGRAVDLDHLQETCLQTFFRNHTYCSSPSSASSFL